MTEKNQKPNLWLKINDFISQYKAVLIVGLTVLTALIGRIGYGVSIFQPLEELSTKQSEYRRKEAQESYRQQMVNNHLTLGNEFLDLGQYKDAKIEFEKALQLDQFSSQAEMGLFKVDINDTIASTPYYDPEILVKRIQTLMKQDPFHAHGYVFMGHVYSTRNEAKAIAYYDSAISKHPGMASAYFGKAIMFDQKGDFKNAERMYKKALDISPWNRPFMGNLAYQYYLNKDFKQAILYCDSLQKLDPYYVVSNYTRATSHLCAGNLNKGIEAYEWLITLMNNDKIVSLPMNTGIWFFIDGEKHSVYFYTNDEKKYYAYYSIALAYCLAGNYEIAEEYRKAADALKLDWYNKQRINDLIKWDIQYLSGQQPQYSGVCERFKTVVGL